MNLCLIVPCFNEEKRLRAESFLDFVQHNPHIHFCFVNDGSSDGTLQLIEDLASRHENLLFHSLEQNSGKAEAVRQGVYSLESSSFDYVGFWDADLATPLIEIESFSRFAALEKYDVIMGSRVLRLGGAIDRKWSRHILGRFFATSASFLLNLPVYDTQCGAKIFAKELIPGLFKERFLSRWLFDVEIIFRYKKLSTFSSEKMMEIPLGHWRDEFGSKLKVRDFLRAPFELIRMYVKYGS